MAAALQLPLPEGASRFSSYARGQQWDFTITLQNLANAPSWRAEEEFPPLSPRRALKIARRSLSTLVGDWGEWSVSAVSLRPIGAENSWIYVVEFSEPSPLHFQVGSYMPASFQIPVLMNGATVVPEHSLDLPSPHARNERPPNNALHLTSGGPFSVARASRARHHWVAARR
jgi:hypothetical protein